MLARLRRQFVLISMALTGIVLVGVLGSTLVATWSTQQDIVQESLDHALNDDLDKLPHMGPRSGVGGQAESGDTRLLALAVDVSDDGVVIKTSRAPVTINSSVLTDVVNVALESTSDTGTMDDLHIAWKRAFYLDDNADDYNSDYFEDLADEYEDLGYTLSARVAIVDTSAMDSAFREQVKSDAVIVIVALIALYAVSSLLASWALEPVERAWEGQRRFIADASHELKTPLAVIIANTEILSNDEAIPAESRRWVESTADEASHMRSLVNDLLELARADEGATSGAMQRTDVDFSDIVDSASLEFDAIAFERVCLIETSIEPDIHLDGDPEWLMRLSKILIDNACKYAAAGTTIDVKLGRNAGHVVLAVTNQGKPIPAEDLPHLFDRFYRSDKARDRETGGFGLGLAIAKGIAEAHGGTISATSSADAGTTFTVTL